MFLELLFGVLGNRVLLGNAFGYLAVELGELAVFLLQQVFGVAHAVAGELAHADQRVSRQAWEVAPDEFCEGRPQSVKTHQIPLAILLSTDRGWDALVRLGVSLRRRQQRRGVSAVDD